MRTQRAFPSALVTACEWALLMPASVFLISAALRLMQPRMHEPARTSWMIFEWTAHHVSAPGAAALFLYLPGIVGFTGATVLLRLWRRDAAFRNDAILAAGLLRRRLSVVLQAVATFLAVAIFVLAAAHAVAD